jgi:hypothetical protein
LYMFLDGVHEDVGAELQDKVNELLDMNYNLERYPRVVFETFEEKDELGLLKALEPLIKDMVIDPDEQWFKQLISEIVGHYSDINMGDYLKRDAENVSTDLDEASNSLSSSHADDVNNIFSKNGT